MILTSWNLTMDGLKHQYMFELHGIDEVIDVQPAADAIETRANVMTAIRGTFSRRRSTAGCRGAHDE